MVNYAHNGLSLRLKILLLIFFWIRLNMYYSRIWAVHLITNNSSKIRMLDLSIFFFNQTEENL